MGTEILNPINAVVNGFLSYLPALLAGLGLLLLGLLVAWIAKRLVVQLALLLRIDHLLARSRWREQLRKADVRQGVFALVGDGAFALVLLIFADNALIAWKFTVLSDLVGAAILFLPRILIAVLIFGSGWYVAGLLQRHLFRLLSEEGLDSASLLSRLGRLLLIFLFSAMALLELDVAREIVIIGFTVIMLSAGVIASIKALRAGERPAADRGREEEG